MKTYEKILFIVGIVSILISAVAYSSVQIGWMIHDTPIRYSDRVDLALSWPIYFFVPGLIIMLYFQFKK